MSSASTCTTESWRLLKNPRPQGLRSDPTPESEQRPEVRIGGYKDTVFGARVVEDDAIFGVLELTVADVNGWKTSHSPVIGSFSPLAGP